MMKNKLPLILTGGLAVVAAIVILVDSREDVQRDVRIGETLLSENDLPKVDQIMISKGDSSVDLKLVDGEWVLQSEGNFPGRAERVVQLLEALTKAKYQRLVGEKNERHSEFGLTDAKILRLKEKGKDILYLHIGDNRDAGGQYVRLEGEAKSYLIDQRPSSDAESENWELKQIVDIEDKEVKSVAFKPHSSRKKTAIKIEREEKEKEFKIVEGKPSGKLLESKVKSVGRLFQHFNFAKKADHSNAKAKAALEAPSEVVMELFDGSVIYVKIGEAGTDPKAYYITITGTPGEKAEEKFKNRIAAVTKLSQKWAFELSGYQGEKFFTASEDYVEKKDEKKDKS